jgi:hypothetical protein
MADGPRSPRTSCASLPANETRPGLTPSERDPAGWLLTAGATVNLIPWEGLRVAIVVCLDWSPGASQDRHAVRLLPRLRLRQGRGAPGRRPRRGRLPTASAQSRKARCRSLGTARRPRLVAVGSRTSRQATGASNASVLASPDRPTSPVEPMVGLAR